MICRNCGTNNVNGGRFCERCGADLAAMGAPAAPSAPAYGAPSAPAYGAPATPAYGAPAAPAVPGKGLAIAGMVCGIVSIVFVFCLAWLGIICSIVGVVLSAIAFKKAKDVGMKNPMAIAGLICSCVTLGLSILSIILAATVISSSMAMFM